MNISDEDDSFCGKPKGKQKGRSGRSVKPSRQVKSTKSSTRPKRGRIMLEEDSSSEKGSEDDSDMDFRDTTKRAAQNRRKNGGRFSLTNMTGRNSELRSSTRFVRKVSYAESEESEEFDDGKKKKSHKVRVHH